MSMKRAASDSGGTRKAPRVSPEPSKGSLGYSIDTVPSEDPTEDSYDTDPSEDPTEDSYDTDPSEDPTEDSYDTDPSGDPTGDSYDTDPSEHSSGTTEEETSGDTPAAPVMERYVGQATSESGTDYSCPLSWPSVNQESPGYLYSSDSDARNDGSQTSGGQTDEDEEHTSHGSSPDQA
ncbi:uncharacterized protein LOC132045225 [Lycium ferocissimum]|uniref:uncharacterized protein LOC132045225 n=1 Tax=Lycium ferocissimum TaxID=112874 RepID=UPI00281571F7|nr:uncharacterized protein LOC132045225 [Lycium ferocissimum]